MAYIVCPKHGGSGAAAVCSHVASRVRDESVGRGKEAEPLFPVRVICAGQKLGPTWLCAACAREHCVPAAGLELEGDAGLERFISVIGFSPVCPKCFQERYDCAT